MAGQGSMAIREIARRAQRDVIAVHSGVHVLLRVGVLKKAEEGGVAFPYDAIHVDFLLKTARIFEPGSANFCAAAREQFAFDRRASIHPAVAGDCA
jgi:predicted transcriptional regulator